MIIIINGTSSTGKSTLSQELQKSLGDGWLNFNTDGYLSMLGPKFLGLHPDNPELCHPNEICYAKKHPDGTYEIVPGPLCSKLYRTIPDILALLAEQGFNIIADSFIPTLEDLNAYKDKLDKPGGGVLFVYLYAPQDVILTREEGRGDRLKGSALHWLKSFECEKGHDLIINTHEISMGKIVEMILEKIL